MSDVRDFKLVDLEDLKVVKSYIDNQAGASATSALHTVALQSSSHIINFYTQESTAVVIGTTIPAFTVDIHDIYDEVGKMSTVTVDGAAKTVVADAITALDTEIGSFTGFTVNGVAQTKVVDAIKALDTKVGGATDITVKKADGSAISAVTEALNQLDSEMGDDAIQVTKLDGTTATDVKVALNALNDRVGVNSTALKVSMVETPGTTADNFLKKYDFYQGSTSVIANKIGTIDLAKDLVVEKGSVVTVTGGVDSEGEATTEADGTYLKLVIANQATRVYINTKDLVEDFTVEAGATEVQLAIDTTSGRELQARLVAGGVDTTAIANNAITTGKMATGSVDSTILATGSVTSAALATSAIVSTITPAASTSAFPTITVAAADQGVVDALNLAYSSLQTTSINVATTAEVANLFA